MRPPRTTWLPEWRPGPYGEWLAHRHSRGSRSCLPEPKLRSTVYRRNRALPTPCQSNRHPTDIELSPEDALLIDIRARLASALATRRAQKQMTQTELARRIKSSQSRVAKMEAADGSVSLDLLIRSLLALGATRKDLATAIAGK
ncbi:MAG TPA: XRE family transcriptional regulator [Pseudomonadota bacterium]|nr:XRE family transcriptional regulator [Pseudomonadota bacterium]